MTDYLKKVTNERDEIAQKMEALEKFARKDIFNDLPAEQQ